MMNLVPIRYVTRMAAAILFVMMSRQLTALQGSAQTGPQAMAQNEELGSLDLIVTDPLGAVVPRAQVTLTAPDGRQTKLLTNSIGRGRFSGLAAGNYTVVVAMQGFKESSLKTEVQKRTPATISVALSIATGSGLWISPGVVMVPTIDPSPNVHLDTYIVLPIKTGKKQH